MVHFDGNTLLNQMAIFYNLLYDTSSEINDKKFGIFREAVFSG